MTPVDNGWTERCGYKPAGIGHSFGMKRCQWHGARNHHARPVGMRWNPAVEMTVCTDGTSPYSYLGWDGRRQNIAQSGTAAALAPLLSESQLTKEVPRERRRKKGGQPLESLEREMEDEKFRGRIMDRGR